MRDVFIVSAVRTPIGRFGGALKDHSPVDLAAPVMEAAVDRAGAPKEAVDLVIFGNVLRAGQGQLVPRQAAIQAGFPKTLDAMAVDMVCSSGMMSAMNAATMIKAGEADLLLAGGTESMSGAGFYLDSGARWGYKFVMGDGAGALYLEELEHAKARGARIYAEITGLGMSADAHHLTAPDPEGGGVQLALNSALENAQLNVEDIDYINTHGTSTPLGDVAETKAVKAVFGDHAYEMNLSSTKSMTGHLLGAAGAVEAIATILAIRNDVVPPTINFEEADPECDLNYTFNEPQERPVRAALSNAFGFGGHNTSLAFQKFEG